MNIIKDVANIIPRLSKSQMELMLLVKIYTLYIMITVLLKFKKRLRQHNTKYSRI